MFAPKSTIHRARAFSGPTLLDHQPAVTTPNQRPTQSTPTSSALSAASLQFSSLNQVFALDFSQVWPVTNFFLFPFCKKIIDLPGGQINDPSSGRMLFSFFLPATPSPFVVKWRPSRALSLASLCCSRNYRYTRTSSGVLPLAQRSQDTAENI